MDYIAREVVFNTDLDAMTTRSKFVVIHPNVHVPISDSIRNVLDKNVNRLGFEFQHISTAEFMTLMTWNSDAIDQESVEGTTDLYLMRLVRDATWIR